MIIYEAVPHLVGTAFISFTLFGMLIWTVIEGDKKDV